MTLFLQSVRVATGSDEEGMLVFDEDHRLAAVLTRLSEQHDGLSGHWFLEAEPATPHNHNRRRADGLSPIPSRTRGRRPWTGAQDVSSDLILRHAHQPRHYGHLVLNITREILIGRDCLRGRRRLTAHPWWTRKLRRLGGGAHILVHGRTILQSDAFLQYSESRTGLQIVGTSFSKSQLRPDLVIDR